MNLKRFILELFQNNNNDDDFEEFEREQFKEIEDRRERLKQERWESLSRNIEENVLIDIYGLVNYDMVKTKYDENYIVALSSIPGRSGFFNIYAIASGTIFILGEGHSSIMSAERLLFEICEREVGGQERKYIRIVDVLITGSKGRGSIAMESLISYAKEIGSSWIEGETSCVDEQTELDKIRRDNFYKKYNFKFEGETGRNLMLRL
ncbi:hypothetical protein [Lactococcus garvieae]|uniref:hypothetical protein n=1 Tax=Lactococcus garvieae TaxID=1363 RepID=UPI0038529E9A